MVMIDCISRLVPGVLNNDVSAEFESFHDNLLEYPQYTRPVVFMDKAVPDVLLTGHHKNIETWRRQKSIERTLERRPDLLKDAVLDKKEKKYLEELIRQKEEKETKTLKESRKSLQIKDFYDKIIFCEIKRCSAVTGSTFLRDKRSY